MRFNSKMISALFAVWGLPESNTLANFFPNLIARLRNAKPNGSSISLTFPFIAGKLNCAKSRICP